MGIEDRESKRPLFEVGGHPVLGFQSIDTGDAVAFSFIVQINVPPTPYNMDFAELLNSAGAWEILKRKEWMDENGGALVPLVQERKCTVDCPGTYKLDFIYTRKHQIHNN